MSVEAATFISQLDPSNPPGGAPKSEGDDHLRLLKAVVQQQFPNLGAEAVIAMAAEINRLVGVTSGVQAQLDAKAPLDSAALTGTPTGPTAPNGTSTTRLATTAFVQAAIAAVNPQTATVMSVDSSAAINLTAGQHVVCTNAAAVPLTLPLNPTPGDTVWVTPGNGRIDNTLLRNGQPIMGLAEDMTIDNVNVTVELRFVNSTLGWRLV